MAISSSKLWLLKPAQTTFKRQLESVYTCFLSMPENVFFFRMAFQQLKWTEEFPRFPVKGRECTMAQDFSIKWPQKNCRDPALTKTAFELQSEFVAGYILQLSEISAIPIQRIENLNP